MAWKRAFLAAGRPRSFPVSCAGDLTSVYVPTVADEAVRDCSRAHKASIGVLKDAKWRLKSLLLRHRLNDTAGLTWNEAHRTLGGGFGQPSSLERGMRWTSVSKVVPNPRISAGSTVAMTGRFS